MKTLLVGEAWGEVEDEYKHAFVGPAGLQLISQLGRSGLGPKLEIKHPSAKDLIDYWSRVRISHGIEIANVFNHHPPENKIGYFFGPSGNRDLPKYKPSQKEPVGYVLPEWMPHLIRLWECVRNERPNLVVALGNVPCWALLHQVKITEIRGSIQRAIPALRPQKILPTFHPSYILRVKADEVIALADFKKAKRESEFPEIRRPEKWITGHNHRTGQRITLEEIREWLSRPAEEYAIDIESGYILYSKAELKCMTQRMRFILSSQISMVGFARTPSDALVIPLMYRERDISSLSYWPEDQLVLAWKYIIQGLKRPIPKIFQNGMYDITRFVEHGILPTMCRFDTMLRHHAAYPELQKSLGFQISLYLNEISHKQMYSNRETLKADE